MKMYMDIQDKRGQHCIEAFEPYLKLAFTPHLVDVVSLDCYLKGVLKQDEQNKIMQTNDENKLDKFLGFLKQCEHSDWYTTFIDVLKREKFELVHVADTLEGTGSASLVAEDYKVLLGKKFETLITKLDPEDFLPVWGHKLLDEQSLQAVNSKPTQRERVVLLLHLMPKRPNWFQNFKKALANYQQYEDVLKSLEETSDGESETRMDMSYFINLMEVFSPRIVETISVTDILPYCPYLNITHW
uniref:Uncharacterized protein n=1 Tax=Ciona savignyi TaxID=51511 RepID=H2ZMV6_CIOSA